MDIIYFITFSLKPEINHIYFRAYSCIYHYLQSFPLIIFRGKIILTMDAFELNKSEETGIKERHEVKPPSLYRVFLLNDDYTTMDFVIEVLEGVFHKSAVEAVQIMLHVHKNGKGLAGVYTREIAETKTHNVNKLARKRDFPLKSIMEKG